MPIARGRPLPEGRTVPATCLHWPQSMRSCIMSDMEDVPPKSFLNENKQSPLGLDGPYGMGTLVDALEQLLFCFVVLTLPLSIVKG